MHAVIAVRMLWLLCIICIHPSTWWVFVVASLQDDTRDPHLLEFIPSCSLLPYWITVSDVNIVQSDSVWLPGPSHKSHLSFHFSFLNHSLWGKSVSLLWDQASSSGEVPAERRCQQPALTCQACECTTSEVSPWVACWHLMTASWETQS